MATSVPTPPAIPARPLLAAILLSLGILAFGGAWMAVASARGSHAGWMALASALNSIAWLRLSGTRPGYPRALAAVVATALSIALGEWLVAALPVASELGQFPLDTASRMGCHFGWMLIELGNTPLDWLMAIVAVILAAWFGR